MPTRLRLDLAPEILGRFRNAKSMENYGKIMEKYGKVWKEYGKYAFPLWKLRLVDFVFAFVRKVWKLWKLYETIMKCMQSSQCYGAL